MGDRGNEDKSDTLSSAQPELRQKADAQDTVTRSKEAGHQGRGLGAQRDHPLGEVAAGTNRTGSLFCIEDGSWESEGVCGTWRKER